MNKKQTALITGATSGIGKAIAYEFAKQGINLVLCGRRQERLEQIKKDLISNTNVYLLNFDVRNKAETLKAIASIPDNFKTIDILINNAGNAHGISAPVLVGIREKRNANAQLISVAKRTLFLGMHFASLR